MTEWVWLGAQLFLTAVIWVSVFLGCKLINGVTQRDLAQIDTAQKAFDESIYAASRVMNARMRHAVESDLDILNAVHAQVELDGEIIENEDKQ